MIVFDKAQEWCPSLAATLSDVLPKNAPKLLEAAKPRYVEDSLKILFGLADRPRVIAATIAWLSANRIAGFHGTRVNEEELDSIERRGLLPLQASDRLVRIERVLKARADWPDMEAKLKAAIDELGPGERMGAREGQVHLTLSRNGLSSGFNHYLLYGSEFDQRVLQHVVSDEALSLLEADGRPVILTCSIPGKAALDAAHPYFGIQLTMDMGEVPNIVREFLEVWAFKQAWPEFQSSSLEVDCGMVFHDAVPPEWPTSVEPWVRPSETL